MGDGKNQSATDHEGQRRGDGCLTTKPVQPANQGISTNGLIDQSV